MDKHSFFYFSLDLGCFIVLHFFWLVCRVRAWRVFRPLFLLFSGQGGKRSSRIKLVIEGFNSIFSELETGESQAGREWGGLSYTKERRESW